MFRSIGATYTQLVAMLNPFITKPLSSYDSSDHCFLFGADRRPYHESYTKVLPKDSAQMSTMETKGRLGITSMKTLQ